MAAFGKDLSGVLPGVRQQLDFSFTAQLNNTTYFDHSGRTTYINAANTAWGVGANNPLSATADQSIDWELCTLFVYYRNRGSICREIYWYRRR